MIEAKPSIPKWQPGVVVDPSELLNNTLIIPIALAGYIADGAPTECPDMTLTL